MRCALNRLGCEKQESRHIVMDDEGNGHAGKTEGQRNEKMICAEILLMPAVRGRN